jgi:hypothetical protein
MTLAAFFGENLSALFNVPIHADSGPVLVNDLLSVILEVGEEYLSVPADLFVRRFG